MKILKQKWIVSLVLFLVFSACFVCFSLARSTNAEQADEPYNAETFEMVKGAQVALNKDGIRFIVKMGKDKFDYIVTNDPENDVSLSVYIAPKPYFDALTGDDAGHYEKLAKKRVIEIDEKQIYTNNGYYYANAVLRNLSMTNNAVLTISQFDYDFVGVGVIEDNTSETPKYTFASFNDGDIANNVRSQYYLLQKAFLDSKENASVLVSEESPSPYSDWFGDTDHPIVIDTLEDYNDFVALINQDLVIPFNVQINGVDTSAADKIDEGKALPMNTKKYHYVSFYNGETLLEKVRVLEGEGAVFTGATPTKVGGDKYSYSFDDSWIEADGYTVANLENITKSMDVYAKFDLNLVREGADIDTVLFFGEETGTAQFTKAEGGNIGDITVDEVDGISVTKLPITLIGASSNYAKIYYDICDYDFNDGDYYVIFDIYLEIDEREEAMTDALSYVDLRFSTTGGICYATRVYDGEWAQVLVPATVFDTTKRANDGNRTRFAIMTNEDGGRKLFNGALYMSKAKAIPASAVKDIATMNNNTTYTLSGVSYIGGGYATTTGTAGDNLTVSYSKIGTPGDKDLSITTGAVNDIWDAVFTQESDMLPYYVNGAIRLYMNTGDYSSPRVAFKFAENKSFSSGYITVTARGLNLTKVYFRNSTNGNYAGEKTFGAGVDAGNGYKTFKTATPFTSGWASEIYDYMVLEFAPSVEGSYSQGIISDISLDRTVNFYNGSTFIKSVTVKYGEGVTFDGATPTKANNGIFSYEFAGEWTTTDGGNEFVDLSAIVSDSSDINVYAKFNEVSPRTGADSDTVFFFGDATYGTSQLTKGLNVNNITVENGMTKIAIDTGSQNYSRVAYDLCDYKFNDGDYVVFDIYLAEGAAALVFKFGSTNATRVERGHWAQVLVSAAVIKNYSEFTLESSANTTSSLYLGKAKAILASAVKDIATTGNEITYTLSGNNYVGGAYATAAGTLGTSSYEVSYRTIGGLSVGAAGWSTNGGVYCQASDVVPYYVNGAIRFYVRSDKYSAPSIVLKLSELKTFTSGKITITARGIDLEGCNVYLRSSQNSAYKGQKAFGAGVDAGNGYKTFTLTTTFNSSWASESYDYLIIQFKPTAAGIYTQGIISSVTLP